MDDKLILSLPANEQLLQGIQTPRRNLADGVSRLVHNSIGESDVVPIGYISLSDDQSDAYQRILEESNPKKKIIKIERRMIIYI